MRARCDAKRYEFVAASWTSTTPAPTQIVFRTAIGDAAGSILETTETERVDLIVMGTQGLAGLRKWLLGSTTESAAMTFSSVSIIGNALRLRSVDCRAMYTERVVTLRSFAFVLALLLTATPVVGVVCEMDCDQVPATPPCHESARFPGGPAVRGAQHACNHDHSTDSPALLAGAGARDSVRAFVVLPLTTLAHALAPDGRVAILAMHGPPGFGSRNTPSAITILRI
jgi:Universal stress protein family